MTRPSAHRGALFTFLDTARFLATAGAYRYHDDGLLLVEGGRVVAAGPAAALLDTLPEGTEVVDHGRRILMPGFIDAHAHAPQTAAIASHGEQLLAWLESYVFPAEAALADPALARAAYSFFLDELLRNGTTTALAYATSHAASTDILFEEALSRSMRLAAGKTMMDRNAPGPLLDTAAASREECAGLIARWHGKGRLSYALTPRFAPTSTPGQLAVAGELLRDHPGVLLQTHLSENLAELAWVGELFPEAIDYLDVYDRFGLLGPRGVFGHCVHLSDRELDRMAETGSVACWCPTSNFFLGSGVFDPVRAAGHGVRLALATDVGAGTSFSMLATLGGAYKAAALHGHSLSPLDGFYLATLGNARALSMDACIGTLAPGKEADFVVLDPEATPLLSYRTGRSRGLEDTLFALMILGDDRAVAETWVAGNLAHRR